MSIEIISPGALTTVQDMGRFGYMKDGFSVCGVMDKYSASLANFLCSNDENCAVLEMTMLGASIRFTKTTELALCGADMEPELDGKRISMNCRFSADSGAVLKLSVAKSGLRTYLAVAGGIDTPAFLGSRSTDLKCSVGGFCGRKLAAGDIIPVGTHNITHEKAEPDTAGISFAPPKSGRVVVRAIPGPQDDAFTALALETFFSAEYEITPKSNRMGMRLSGPALEAVTTTDIMSDGIAEGSVQVPGGGQPIVLMADRQTTGGYAKIATVISADLPVLAQARPGDKVRFVRCSLEEAVAALKKQRIELDKYKQL